MKVSPWILGAAAFVPIVGAIAGSQISTQPIGSVVDVTSNLPDRTSSGLADASPRTNPRLPDHYAMETPEGVVEVHELAMRGRYADRWQAARAYDEQIEAELASLEARWDDGALESESARLLDARQPRVTDNRYERQANRTQTTPRQPLDLQEPAEVKQQPQIELAVATTSIRPRIVDVQAELARQR